LRRRVEYVDVQQHGRRAQSDHFLALLIIDRRGRESRPSETAPAESARTGVTVSSKVGNAVVRNRLKRWIREYVRRHRRDLPVGRMVIVARPSAAEIDHTVADRELERLLHAARELR
jgi:ribonuclease P protein component